MSPRVSTRVRVALALAACLVPGAVANLVVTMSLLERSMERQSTRVLAATARALAGCVSAACLGRQEGCATARALDASSGDLAVYILEGTGDEEKDVGRAVLPGSGVLTVRSRIGASSQTAAVGLLVAYNGLTALMSFLVGLLLLNRLLAQPLDSLAQAAERIGRLDLDGPVGGQFPTLGPLGMAFERMASNLKEERARVTAQIAELERLNRQLADARDSLVRSEKLATVGRLAAGVAHEVGNPLGAILGYLEMARAKAPPEMEEHLARIDREVARIDRTVRGLLDFSRPAQTTLGGELLSRAVDSAVRLASVQKRLKHVTFDVAVPPELRVLAEGHHLSQVLVNVLLNAGDAMGGDGTVTIRALRKDVALARRASDLPSGPRVELEISDSGPGIAPEDLARIFDPFFTTKDPGDGTGLGLAICHRIMESFGGEIRAANRAQRGAVFTLIFREAPQPSPG